MRKALLALVIAALVGLNAYQWVLRTRPPSDQDTINRFQALFVGCQTLLKSTWLGVQAIQHPFDAWVTQEIFWEVKPEVVVETGTLYGGSALLWATIMEQIVPDHRVVTIDVNEAPKLAIARAHPLWQRHVEFLKGSSTAPNIVAEVEKRAKGKRVIVILDALHTKDHVLAELRAYAPLVPVGSYVIVQDTHLGDQIPHWYMAAADWWTPGPLKAVEEFLATNKDFEVDASRERFMATNNHRGFLKRVR